MPKTIQIMRKGTQTDSAGNKITFDDAILEQAADFASSGKFEVPGVIGHPKDNSPAWAWAKKVSYDRGTGIMSADIEETDPAFAEMLEKRMFNKISSSFFSPTSPANPNPGHYTLRHIGFLGGAAPAVPGLAPVNFSEAEGTHDFADWDAMQSAGLFRNIRDWIIGKFGIEEADKVIPSYTVGSLEQSAVAEPADAVSPAFSETAVAQEAVLANTEVATEPAVAPAVEAAASAAEFTAEAPAAAAVEAPVAEIVAQSKPDAPTNDYTEKEAQLMAREAALAAREAELEVAEFTSFCDGLGTAGQLPGVLHGHAIAIFRSLNTGATIDFAEEGEVSAKTLFRNFLAALPPTVDFSELAKEEGAPSVDESNFVAPYGAEVDQESSALAAKARAYMKQNPGVGFLEAAAKLQS